MYIHPCLEFGQLSCYDPDKPFDRLQDAGEMNATALHESCEFLRKSKDDI
jgi:hypothetical protein